MKKITLVIIILFHCTFGKSQSTQQKIETLNEKIRVLNQEEDLLKNQIGELKLEKIREDIVNVGLPELKEGEEIISHAAMSLVYDEKHEQAKWVSHIIVPDVINGKVKRSNNFRKDPLVKTESASSRDYFIKYKDKTTGKYKYDGFGYDRGHLAPSADFRWNKKALSESYYYSNMSPQLADFNREKWADLEGLLRVYISENPTTQLYIVTGPILNDSLTFVERSLNKVSIPNYYYKIALDLNNKKAIAFIMPNKKISNPVNSFAVPINEVEEATGINFFYQLPDSLEDVLEHQNNVKDWLPEKLQGDVAPIYQPSLSPGIYNTVQAKRHMGSSKKVAVSGTVVGGRKTRNGHLFFNLDKQYPNQIFTVAIWKQNIPNFSYNPLKEWEGKQITLKGKIADFDGTPTMIIEKETVVEVN